MKISVIVTTWNRRGLLSRTLPTVLNQDFPVAQREVIVVVDGSNDGTIDYLETVRPDCALRVISQPNRGPAAARNIGLQAAGGAIVLFLDDDLVCDNDLIRHHVAAHESSGEALVAFGEVREADADSGAAAALKAKHFGRTYGRGDRAALGQLGMSANRSVLKSVLTACGGWDERFRKIGEPEDGELAARLVKSGVPFRFIAAATVHELYSKSEDDVIAEAIEAGRGEVKLARMHSNYREYAPLPIRWREESALKSIFVKLVRRVPAAAEAALRPLFAVSSQLRRSDWDRSLAMSILDARVAAAALRGVGREAGSWRAFDQEFGRQLPALVYHHVGPANAQSPDGLSLSGARFEQHVEWLANHGFRSIGHLEWLQWRKHGVALPDKPILITFDDAFADVASCALPVLKRYGFTATIFVPTARVGGYLARDPSDPQADRHEYVAAGAAGSPLKESWPRLDIMSAMDIRKWANDGFEFGSHTRTHPELPGLSAAQLEDEIAGSRDELAKLTGLRVSCFAYPYGKSDERARDLVRASYGAGFSIEHGLNTLATQPHFLKRTQVSAIDGVWSFRFLVSTGKRPADFIPDSARRMKWLRSLASRDPGKLSSKRLSTVGSGNGLVRIQKS